MIRLKSLLKESLLNELDFGSQKAFDSYQKQHDMRDDTEVTVAGKKMSVGQAVKQSKDPELKGSSVFGKGAGSKVFGDKKRYDVSFGDSESDAARSIYNKEFEKQKQSGRDFSKDPFPQFGSDAWNRMHSDMVKKAAEQNPGYQKIKGISDKIEKMGWEIDHQGWGNYNRALIGKSFTKKNDDGSVSDIYMMPTTDGNIEVKSTKATKSEKKRGGLMGLLGKKDKSIDYSSTDREVIDISGKSDDEVIDAITQHVSKLDEPKEKSADGGTGGAKEKSITDIKVDAKVDVSKVSKSLLPNLKLDMSPGGADKDANELKNRLEKGQKGSYTRTSPTGGRIDFEDGASFDVYRPHTYKKTKDTKIYASKQNK